ncbi:MAG: hypothetical protein Q8N56_03420 [bacterium]|nr:hypothetical protein [bacterium]
MTKKIKSKKKSSNTSRKESLVVCAFCRGIGLDRFGVPSKLSKCQTCQGRGKVYVPEPHEKCASCLGTGVYRHHRLTCSVCGGKGRVRSLNRVRGAGCEKENEEALDVETGLPCISAYELGKNQ